MLKAKLVFLSGRESPTDRKAFEITDRRSETCYNRPAGCFKRPAGCFEHPAGCYKRPAGRFKNLVLKIIISLAMGHDFTACA